MFTDRGMNKNGAHIDNGILFRTKKELNNVIRSNMDGKEMVILSEVSQRNVSIVSLTC